MPLPFALSRFIAAHFSTPNDELPQSRRWRALSGVSLSPSMQAYLQIGGMKGRGFVPTKSAPQWRPGNLEKEAQPLERCIEAAQERGDTLPLLEPFLGAFPIGDAPDVGPVFALVSARSSRTPIVGYDPELDAVHRLYADDVNSFAALNHLSIKIGDSKRAATNRSLKGLVGALDERVAFAPPYRTLEAVLAYTDVIPDEYDPSPSPLRFALRVSYLLRLLVHGELSLEQWLAFAQPDANPRAALKNIPKNPPTALYWLWRLYFEGYDEALDSVLDAARSSESTFIKDAVRLVEELRQGRRELGTVADVAALREEVSSTVRDPAKLAASRAAQRRETVDKRVVATRVPSGIRFEAVAGVPRGWTQDVDAPNHERDGVVLELDAAGNVVKRSGDTTRKLLPPEPGTKRIGLCVLPGDYFAVLTETLSDAATQRRLSLYADGTRVHRLGGNIFQDTAGRAGIVPAGDHSVLLWKEAIEGERMFPWTGRVTVYGLHKHHLASLGGATFDCVGARAVGEDAYGLRADDSGYRLMNLEGALEGLGDSNRGPRFAPIPTVEVEDPPAWRDVFEPGPIAIEGQQLVWTRMGLRRTAPCPEHLRAEGDDFGHVMSRDGKVAWLMTRTGTQVDRLDLMAGRVEALAQWPSEEGWAVGVGELDGDVVVASTWKLRVVTADGKKTLWELEVPEVTAVAGTPSRHFGVLHRGRSGPGSLTLHYVRALEEAPENAEDAAGEWSTWGFAGETLYLAHSGDAIAVVGPDEQGHLDPDAFERVPHWATSRGWFENPAKTQGED